MKSRNFILTHAAVFAAGAALALLTHGPLANPFGGDADAAARADSSHGDTGTGSDDRSAALRDRREGKSARAHSNEPAPKRLAAIALIADPLERQAALMELLGRLAPGDFAAVAEQYRSIDHYGDSRGEYDLILRTWAKADPLAALTYTENQPNNGRDTSTILASWAGKDAAAAEHWALDHHTGDGPNPYLVSVIRGIAAYDIGHASELAQAMPSSRERGMAVDSITRALMMQGTDAAMAFPASIQDPALRAGFVASVADRLAAKDPAQAATWLASSTDAESQTGAARSVGQALAKNDPTAATQWLQKLQPTAQAEAARGIIPVMSSDDIAKTATWASSLVGIPNYDKVVEEFVWSCDNRAPEQSAAWIQSVTDPDQRRRLYYSMLGEWAKRDAAAVKTWVSSNAVPADVLRRFSH
ncbi:MAG: hypothetical protein WCK77_09095 [Verrucomicrobiota bacterium]